MSDTLYIKIDRNIVINKPQAVLSDIAKLTCTKQEIVNKLKTMKVYTFQQEKESKKPKNQFKVFSVLKIIEQIGAEYPNLDVQNLGEADFVLEYVPIPAKQGWMVAKTVLVCILVFFGSAFTIMTFNNDVGVKDVFDKIYQQVMGTQSSGFTPLEISYAIGLGLGILIFFNHVGRKKITPDPTPLQVQMRTYEKETDDTFIQNSSRKGSNIDVG